MSPIAVAPIAMKSAFQEKWVLLLSIKEYRQVVGKRDLLVNMAHVAVDELVPRGDVAALQERVERDGPVTRSLDLYGFDGTIAFGEELDFAVAVCAYPIARLKRATTTSSAGAGTRST